MNKFWQDMTDDEKFVVDWVSIMTTMGALFQYLPAIATLFTVIWTAIRIYETKTIQRLLGNKCDEEPVDKD